MAWTVHFFKECGWSFIWQQYKRSHCETFAPEHGYDRFSSSQKEETKMAINKKEMKINGCWFASWNLSHKLWKRGKLLFSVVTKKSHTCQKSFTFWQDLWRLRASSMKWNYWIFSTSTLYFSQSIEHSFILGAPLRSALRSPRKIQTTLRSRSLPNIRFPLIFPLIE